MRIFIIGGGKKVYFMSKSFISKGYKVTIINNDREYCRKMARQVKAAVIYGDGTKIKVLEDAEIMYADMVLALTPKDSDNLIICQIADKLFDIKKTFSIVNDPKNVELFKNLGVETVISTTAIISSIIEQKISVDDINSLFSLDQGNITVMEIEINTGDRSADKAVKNLDATKDFIISYIIKKNGQRVIPNGETIIENGDRLIVMSLLEVQSRVLKALKGDII